VTARAKPPEAGGETGAQDRWDIRCEWGPEGLAGLAPLSGVVIIVDVLSFSTCVDVAVSRGAIVFPYPWRDARAAAFARDVGAELAGPRGESALSLSPASLMRVSPGARVVLPSPNGATLSLRAGANLVLAGCLRNASAVARAATAAGRRVLVVPAGEQWPGGSLRPSLEDWLGAGAIVDGLTGTRSPEAEAASAAFRAAGATLPRLVRDCTSGQALISRGYGDDVRVSVELNVSETVPVLRDRAYQRLG